MINCDVFNYGMLGTYDSEPPDFFENQDWKFVGEIFTLTGHLALTRASLLLIATACS